MHIVQNNVSLTMKMIGEIRQEQAATARELGSKQSPQGSLAGDGILGTPPQQGRPPVPHVPPPVFVPHTVHHEAEHSGIELQSKKTWMPKMDFPRFEG